MLKMSELPSLTYKVKKMPLGWRGKLEKGAIGTFSTGLVNSRLPMEIGCA
jgi:hypothetical protein